MLHVHAACACCMCVLHVRAACACCMCMPPARLQAGNLFVGDTIVSVGGVAVSDAVHCATLLRAAVDRVLVEVVLTSAAQARPARLAARGIALFQS